MKVSTKEQPEREAVLSIQMDAEDVEPYLERAYRKIVQRANIPGFRKGKAPRRIVEQVYGREYLLNEALDFMVPEVTNKAVEEASLELAGVPSVQLEQTDPPSITATVPLTPTTDLGGYLNIRISKEKVKVTKEQVGEVVERLRMELAPWEPVEKPLALGDLVNMSVRGTADGKEVINQERADFIPQEGQRVPAPGFAEALVGMKAQETREITIDVPEDFEHPEVAGKSCQFEVTVHIVKRKQPRKLDDEFAKGVGSGYDSLAGMRQKIEEDLAEERRQTVDAKHRDETLEKVLEGASFELSPLIVDHELEHLLHDHQEAVRTGRMTAGQYQQYLSWAGKSAEEIREVSRPEAEARVKRSLVLQEVAKAQGLEVTDEDVDAEVQSMADGSETEADNIREMFASQNYRESLRRMLLDRKCLDFLTGIAANGTRPAKKPAKTASRTTTKRRKQPRASSSAKANEAEASETAEGA